MDQLEEMRRHYIREMDEAVALMAETGAREATFDEDVVRQLGQLLRALRSPERALERMPDRTPAAVPERMPEGKPDGVDEEVWKLLLDE